MQNRGNQSKSSTRKINTNSSRTQTGTSYRNEPIEPFPVSANRRQASQNRTAQTAASNSHKQTQKAKKRTQKQQTQPTAATQRRRMTRSEMRRRRRNRIIIGVLLAILLIGVGLALSVTVLFKLESFRLENPDKSVPAQTGIYSEDAILSAVNLPLGENLFQFSLKETQTKADEALPYLESISLRRSLPSTVVIQVTPAKESWALPTQNGWLVLSEGLKIMTLQAEQPQGLPAIYGVVPESEQAGKRLSVKAAEPARPESDTSESGETAQKEDSAEPDKTLEHFAQLTDQLQQQNLLAGVTHLALDEGGNAYFIYESRIKVIVGTYNNLDYKISVAALLLHNETGAYLSASDKGVLDVSYQQEDGSIRPPFAPGSFDFPVVDVQYETDDTAATEPQEPFDAEPMPEITPETTPDS